jgi:hypothetical protein
MQHSFYAFNCLKGLISDSFLKFTWLIIIEEYSTKFKDVVVTTYLKEIEKRSRRMKTVKTSALLLMFLLISITLATILIIKPAKATGLVGDVDHDGDVDIDDVTAACIAYDSRTGDPLYNATADVSPEWGLINIFDIVTIISHYGEGT